MRSVVRVSWIGVLVLALSLPLVGCKKDKKDQPGAAGKEAAMAANTPPPQVLISTLGLRNPGKVLDSGLALAGKFATVPFTRPALLAFVAQKAKMDPALVEALDMGGTLWLAALDDKAVGHNEPFVASLPITSKKAFEEALAKKMKKEKTEGELTRYVAKQGAPGGMDGIWVAVEDKFVTVPSGPKAYDLVKDYLKGVLRSQEPKHDITLKVLVPNLLAVKGDTIDAELKNVMREMRQGAEQAKGGMDPDQVAAATEKTVSRYVELFKSAREVVFGVDVDKDWLSLSLSGVARGEGKLAELIKQQRTGDPLGAARLPASSWLVVSDHGNPKSLEKDRTAWESTLKSMLSDRDPDPKEREAFLAAIRAMADVTTGDGTVALHKSPDGSGVMLSAISAVSDGDKARAAADKVADLMGEMIKREVEKKGEKLPKDLKVSRTPFEYKGAKGTLVAMNLPAETKKEKNAEVFTGLLGDPFTVGWAFLDNYGLFVLGKGAEAGLKALVDGPQKGTALAEKPDFQRIVGTGNNRVGLVYLSLVDLANWFMGTPLEQTFAMLAPLKGKQAKNSPFLDWGVDDKRQSLDFTLQLPADHFLLFKGVAEKMMKSGFPAEKMFAPPKFK